MSHQAKRTLQHRIRAGEMFMAARRQELLERLKPWLADEYACEQLQQELSFAEEVTDTTIELEPLSTLPLLCNLKEEAVATPTIVQPLMRVALTHVEVNVHNAQVRHGWKTSTSHDALAFKNLCKANYLLDSEFPASIGLIKQVKEYKDGNRTIVPYLPNLSRRVFTPNPYYVTISNLPRVVAYLGSSETNPLIRRMFRAFPFPNPKWSDNDVLVNWHDYLIDYSYDKYLDDINSIKNAYPKYVFNDYNLEYGTATSDYSVMSCKGHFCDEIMTRVYSDPNCFVTRRRSYNLVPCYLPKNTEFTQYKEFSRIGGTLREIVRGIA